MRRRALKAVTACLLACMAGFSLLATAQEDDEEIIKYRQNLMKSQGGHMGALAAIVRGKVDFGKDMLVHARAVEGTSADIPKLFPEGSDFGETKAKPEIWKKWDEFQKYAREAHEKAGVFAKAVESGDKQQIGSRFKELADACKQCHEDFRKEEKR